MDLRNLILSDTEYDKEMREIVVPFTKNIESDGYFKSFDDSSIYYRFYKVASASKNIIIVHGFSENSEKYRELIYYFLKNGFNVFIMDLRGQGYSERIVDNPVLVDVEDFDYYVKDLDLFVETIVINECDNLPICLYAHSMGGAVALLYLEKYKHRISKAVLSTPMVVQRTYIPGFILRLYLNICTSLNKDKSVLPFLKSEFPNRERFDLVSNGSKIKYSYYYKIISKDTHYQNFSGTIRWMNQCMKASKEIRKEDNKKNLNIPFLVFTVKKDVRVRTNETKRFFLGVNDSKVVNVEGHIRHEIYNTEEIILTDYIEKVLKFYN